VAMAQKLVHSGGQNQKAGGGGSLFRTCTHHTYRLTHYIQVPSFPINISRGHRGVIEGELDHKLLKFRVPASGTRLLAPSGGGGIWSSPSTRIHIPTRSSMSDWPVG
jgi:hypothetical protein